MSYVAVDNDIWTSTVLSQGPTVVSTWLLLMASADRYGVTRATPSSVASVLRIPDEEAEKAFEVLLSPDKRSRNKENKGARMTAMDDGAFLLVSFAKYRKKASKAAAAKRQKDYEARVKAGQPVNRELTPDQMKRIEKSGERTPEDITAIRARQAADFEAKAEAAAVSEGEYKATEVLAPGAPLPEAAAAKPQKKKVDANDGRARCGQLNTRGKACLKWTHEGRQACLEHLQLGAMGATPPRCATENCGGFAATPNTSFCMEHYSEQATPEVTE